MLFLTHTICMCVDPFCVLCEHAILKTQSTKCASSSYTQHKVGWNNDMRGSRLLKSRRISKKGHTCWDKTASPLFSAVGMDVTQNVQQDASYVSICRSGVGTRCTFCCVTSHKMYSQPWRSNQFTSLFEAFYYISCWCVSLVVLSTRGKIYVHLLVPSLHVFHGFRCTEQLCLREKEEHIDTQHVRHVSSSQQSINEKVGRISPTHRHLA